MKIFVNIPEGFRNNSFITDRIKKKLSDVADVCYNTTSKPLHSKELAEQLKDADAVITGWGQPLMKKEDLGSVKIIAHTGGTIGGIVDVDVFGSGVTVLSGNNYYAESVSEGVIAYMLYGLRNMGYYENELRSGQWTWDTKTKGLLNRSVGLISYGAISSRVIPKLRLFTDDIRVYSTHKNAELAQKEGFKYAELDEIFAECDVVSVHTAKNPQTIHMIGKKQFELLKDGALFINTSRGAVINELELIEALKNENFTAVLDVYEKEPLEENNPLRSLKNVILFPHMAGPTYDMREKITSALIDDLILIDKGGKSSNEITKEMALRMTIS